MTKRVDIVVPIFNEEETLPELHRRLHQLFSNVEGVDWRVLYINDGSEDNTLQLVLEQGKADSRFQVVDLSRNFGHQAAITAGMAFADADAVVIMDGDLQDPPEIIPELIARWEVGAKVVLAERRSRQERGLKRVAFDLFYRLFAWFSDTEFKANSGVFGLMDAQVVREFNELPEKNRFIPGLRSWIGFEQETVFYDRQGRLAGTPKQSLNRLIKYALDAIFSFSYKPLRLFTAGGVFLSLIGVSLGVFFVMRRVLGIETAQTGFTTLALLVIIFGGLQLVFIGVLGEYIARIYDEVKQRPMYIVRKTYGVRSQNNQVETNLSTPKVVGE